MRADTAPNRRGCLLDTLRNRGDVAPMKTLFATLFVSLFLCACASAPKEQSGDDYQAVRGPQIVPTTASASTVDDFENNQFHRGSCNGTPSGMAVSGYLAPGPDGNCKEAVRTCMDGSWVGPEVSPLCNEIVQ